MGSYYYLVAQLPNLVYGQQATMSAAYFRTLAKTYLTAGDSALLDMVSLDPQLSEQNEKPPASGSDFIDKWREWERSLRLNLARNRFQALKREGAIPDAPDAPPDAATAAKAAVVMDSPLEAEIALDKFRWDAIEALQGLTLFSENTVFAYLLKLLILERRLSFKTEEGFKEYKALYAAILQGAEGVRGPVGPLVGEPK
ncbi:hypothetical protein AGMMS4952_10390 [Spirochaetia bacterium]|nr:hypothetical protein AGMMS4952_10390 [Spirochaetia bacterium]